MTDHDADLADVGLFSLDDYARFVAEVVADRAPEPTDRETIDAALAAMQQLEADAIAAHAWLRRWIIAGWDGHQITWAPGPESPPET